MKINRREWTRLALAAAASGFAVPNPVLCAQTVRQVEFQPFAAAMKRLLNALHSLGTPLPSETEAKIGEALKASSLHQKSGAIKAIENALAPHVLLNVDINPEMRIAVSRGLAPAELIQGGWRTFLVRVQNAAGTTPTLTIKSPQGAPTGRRSSLAITGVQDFTNGAIDAVESRNRWLGISNFNAQPLTPALSGFEIEYRILQLYSRDAGQREATLQADFGWGEQDLGYRSSLPILFRCQTAAAVTVRLQDEDGKSTIASLLIRDELNRVYPPQTKRTMPDLNFQPQIYRYDGESLLLPYGRYFVQAARGPEYLASPQTVEVNSHSTMLDIKLDRWIKPAMFGYYSGDTHIHAAGCSHYESPTEGVTPIVMKRQAEGEALDLASVLNWGPGFEYQKQFFTGHDLSPLVQTNAPAPTHDGMQHNAHAIASDEDASIIDAVQHAAIQPASASLMRYDVEVSGFPSSHCGHLVLLALKEDVYPGAHGIDDWPSWNGPILHWAQQQEAFAGYAHAGHGLVVNSTSLPNLLTPPFDSSGANEFIADVTHKALIDFISGCDLWPFAEMNIWYHTLNCGFATPFVGETDFPCLTDACVGGGRSYARLKSRPSGDEGYASWIDALLNYSSYFGDGRSHLFNFRVNGVERNIDSLQFSSETEVEITAQVAARLEPQATGDTRAIQRASPYDKPYWHLERARIGETRKVPVELVVNGQSITRTIIEADGQPRPVHFKTFISQSSWIALRVYPSSHTNPIFVHVDKRPVRASRDSAEWCRRGVDVCWEQKRRRIRPEELSAASAHFEHARRAYDMILAEFK